MHTVVVGLNYKTTEVNSREKIYFSAEMQEKALPVLLAYPAIRECVILSTCNRVEVYAVTNNVDLAISSINSFIGDFHNITEEVYAPYLYNLKCEEAITHLFNVACSLNSMIIGEYEILGQVKCAYEKAQSLGCTKEFFNRLFQMAIEVGKRVRTETNIGKGAVSVGSVATGLIKDIFSADRKLHVMIIGAGSVAELTARNLIGKVNCELTVTNRSKAKAEEFAKAFDASCVDYEDKDQYYSMQDVLVFSTGAQDYVITANDVSKLSPGSERKLALIDLSVPRNVDPLLAKYEGVFLYTVDDLQSVVDTSMGEREQEILRAKEIIKEQESKFFEWYNMLSVFPVMRQIKKEFVNMQGKLLENYKSDLSGLNEYQNAIVKKMMESYSEIIIKTIMLNLKEVTDPMTLHHIGEALKKTFKIHDTQNAHA